MDGLGPMAPPLPAAAAAMPAAGAAMQHIAQPGGLIGDGHAMAGGAHQVMVQSQAGLAMAAVAEPGEQFLRLAVALLALHALLNDTDDDGKRNTLALMALLLVAAAMGDGAGSLNHQPPANAGVSAAGYSAAGVAVAPPPTGGLLDVTA